MVVVAVVAAAVVVVVLLLLPVARSTRLVYEHVRLTRASRSMLCGEAGESTTMLLQSDVCERLATCCA